MYMGKYFIYVLIGIHKYVIDVGHYKYLHKLVVSIHKLVNRRQESNKYLATWQNHTNTITSTKQCLLEKKYILSSNIGHSSLQTLQRMWVAVSLVIGARVGLVPILNNLIIIELRPGILVPRATKTMAVTESLMPKVQPKCDATSPIMAVTTPIDRIDTTKQRYPPAISEILNNH